MTLIELMMVLVILGILATLAMPSFRELILSQRVRSSASSLQAALMQARSEALKRNTAVTLEPALGSQWNTGWRIVDPTDSSGSASLLQSEAVPALAIVGPASVSYVSSGRLSGTSSASFKVSASGTSTVRCLSVNLTGMPSVTSSGC